MNKLFCIRFVLLFLSTLLCFSVSAEESEVKIRAANVWIDYGEIGKAIILLKEAQAFEKVSQSKINTSLGRIYFRLGKYEKSQELYESAIHSTSSDDASGYLGLAQAYLESGNLKRAQRYAGTVIKGKEKIVEASLVLSEIDARSGNREEAENRLNQLFVKRPHDEQVAIAISNFLFNYDNRTIAITKLEEFISVHPDAANAIEYLSRLKDFIGNINESINIGYLAADIYDKRGEMLRANILREILKKKEITITGEDKLKNEDVLDKKDEAVKKEEVDKKRKDNNNKKEIKPESDKSNIVEKEKVIDPKNKPSEKVKIDKSEEQNKSQDYEEVENNKIIISKSLSNKFLKKWWNNMRGSMQDVRNLPFGKGPIMTGSGFVLNEGKYVITNYHVIENANIIAVRNGKGLIRGGEKVYFDEKNDLAVIKLNDSFPVNAILSINNFQDPMAGSDALVIGFPLSDYFGWQFPSITEGLVTKASGLVDNPNHIMISSKMNLGNSGGPVVDEKGCLIGIAVAKLDKSLIYKEEGFIPEDMNIAIKPSVAAKMFEGFNNLKCATTKIFHRTELYEFMLSKVVNVIASEH